MRLIDPANQHSDKQKIAVSFGRAAAAYDLHAKLQQDCAGRLLAIIAAYQPSLPAGAILEIGCGTGLITRGLTTCFTQRSIEITDLSTEMLQRCRAQLNFSNGGGLVAFHNLDAEDIQSLDKKYAAIVGGFVIQWFKNPAQTLNSLIAKLHPQGVLFLSFPTCRSFPEWRVICRQLNLPYTANSLPDPALLQQALPTYVQCQTETVDLITTHNSAADFLHSLKAIGAGVNQTQKRLTVLQMKQLIRQWNAQAIQGLDQIQVHHQVALWAIRRLAS